MEFVTLVKILDVQTARPTVVMRFVKAPRIILEVLIIALKTVDVIMMVNVNQIEGNHVIHAQKIVAPLIVIMMVLANQLKGKIVRIVKIVLVVMVLVALGALAPPVAILQNHVTPLVQMEFVVLMK